MNTAKLKSNALPIIIILGSVLIGVSLVYFYKPSEFAIIIDECGEEVEIDKTVSEERAVEVAKQWVKLESATYRERSDRGGIELIDVTTRDEGEYEVILQFTTNNEGFGPPEEGEDVERGELERTAKVLMYYDYISMVVIDGVWCDYDHREVTKREIEAWIPPQYAAEVRIEEEMVDVREMEGREILYEETREENGKTIWETEVEYEEEGEVVYEETVFDSTTFEMIEGKKEIRDAETGEVVREIKDWTETDEETGEEIRMRELKNIAEGYIDISRVREDAEGIISEITTYDLETGKVLEKRIIEYRVESDRMIRTDKTLDIETGEVIKKEVID